jgi:hypothetical protein
MAALTLGSQQPAAAQGIFEFLFSGLRHTHETPSLPINLQAYADPAGSPPVQRADAEPTVAYCVRTCDGHYFPVRAQPGMSAAAICHAFCPASQTRLYSGSNIDYAVTRDGSRYADLDTAYVYRQHLVAGCTCNGHDVFGLAHIDPASDPTLRPGDVVATKNGLMAFTGTKDRAADFTPVASYRGFSSSYRAMLSAMKIASPNAGAPAVITSSIAPTDDNRSAQLVR